MLTQEFVNQMSNALCCCSKQNYEEGEKSLYSGYMNQWHIYDAKILTYVKSIKKTRGRKNRTEYEMGQRFEPGYMFCYRQKPIVFVEDWVNDNPKYFNEWISNPKSKKLKQLAKTAGYYSFPHFSYFCSFMVGKIRPYGKSEMRFTWMSGDDDLGNHFTFPNEYLKTVKKFFLDNFKSENFEKLLADFVIENFKNQFKFC